MAITSAASMAAAASGRTRAPAGCRRTRRMCCRRTAIFDSPATEVPSSNSAIIDASASVAGRIRPQMPSIRPACSIASQKSCSSSVSALRIRFPRLWPPTSCVPLNRKLKSGVSIDRPLDSASRQFRISPGGSIRYASRRRPELPPSSATVTIAVRRSRRAVARRAGGKRASLGPPRGTGSRVPPPSATSRGAGAVGSVASGRRVDQSLPAMRGPLRREHAVDEFGGGDEARPEVLQQQDQALHAGQRLHEVVIVTEPGAEVRSPYARLRRIELPRVQVHDVVAITHEGPPHEASKQRRRKHAEVPATGHRERGRREALDGKRELDQAVAGPIDTGPQARAQLREATVAPVQRERVEARVVAEEVLAQDLQVALADAEGRRPVSDDRRAGDVLQRLPAAPQIVAEFALGELHGQDVAVAMTGDLVAARSDVVDQRRLAVGHPPQDEERRSNTVRIEEVEHHTGPVAGPARAVVPGGSRKYRP